jgi:hypothetical protein
MRLASCLATARVRRAFVSKGLAPTTNETVKSTELRVQRATTELRAYLDTLNIEPK